MIIGGGWAGCVLASRLSAAARPALIKKGDRLRPKISNQNLLIADAPMRTATGRKSAVYA